MVLGTLRMARLRPISRCWSVIGGVQRQCRYMHVASRNSRPSNQPSSAAEEVHDEWHDYVRDGFCEAVGKTPLIRLQKLSEETGCNIMGKAEFMNPGGSVKDRAALYIVKDAEERGLLRAGGTLIEGTAGNTGIGMAHICNARGYKCVIYMPDTQSKEKIDLLKMLGAEVRAVPAVPYDNPDQYQHQAKRAAEGRDNCFHGNQFDSVANRQSHYETTGPEIWHQMRGNVDVFVAASGTGGTVAGTGQFLKEKNDQVSVVLADPPGSSLYSYFKTGEHERGGGSITEGIGNGRITGNMEGVDFIDDQLKIEDKDTIRMVYRLIREEGLFLGASSCLNVVAAHQLGQRFAGSGKTIVTVLCDGAQRYQSRLFSRSWLKSKGLYDVLSEEDRRLIASD
eukprot:TRINITY_DN5440_c0_g1_i1.p1 TRINITY_DN5440_c0_g1~~TRINITY_DN5440_c0_g1_i1.p1  ORF type:complete len:395 (-),score=56.80 TRINITY_DN5440_c0_g1_i1:179-1363(-)